MKTRIPKATKSTQLKEKRKGASLAPPPLLRKFNNTGMPDQLKSGVENLSGIDMSDVKVHYNSSQPAQLNAHAYAQGNQIHIAPGQEKHLPHEAWHVVQQKQGRVKPTKQFKGKVNINDDKVLENEADVMGSKALGIHQRMKFTSISSSSTSKLMTPARPGFSTYAPFQLTDSGRWWGSKIGGAIGGISSLGFAAAGAVAGGIGGSVTGGAKGLWNHGIYGGITGAISGGVGGAIHTGAKVAGMGAKIGSSIGSSLMELVTGPEVLPLIPDIEQRMRDNLEALSNEVAPILKPEIRNHEGMTSEMLTDMKPNETKLLNWMHNVLGPENFNVVAKGGQVRIPFNAGVFQAFIGLGAQRRQSSHYAGLVFPSGFRQVVDEQYGTKGEFLPTVLFGKIMDRSNQPFMYFQPEGHAFNPDTGLMEKFSHVVDASLYFGLGDQQGPHGQSRRTDADPITGTGVKYKPTLSDRFGWARAGDLAAFAQNLYHNSVSSEVRGKIAVKANTGMEILKSMRAVKQALRLYNTVKTFFQ